MNRYSLILLVAVVAYTPTKHAHAQDSMTLTVIVTGARPDTGKALGSLFDSRESYLKRPIQEAVASIDEQGLARLTFENLAAGTYAVSVIYDEDADGELDKGFLGIPTELIAMSNNVQGRFGPPSFKKTSFEVKSNMTIELRFATAKD